MLSARRLLQARGLRKHGSAQLLRRAAPQAGLRRWMSTSTSNSGESDSSPLADLYPRSSVEEIVVNGRTYKLPESSRPIVGICLDGTSLDYITEAMKAGCMPQWSRIIGDPNDPNVSFADRESYRLSHGTQALVTTAYPTFTNPNNVAIATGVPSNVNGICGNYYLDEDENEVMMTSPSLLRCPTIFSELIKCGVRVTIVTTKDKLRGLLSAHLLTSPVGSEVLNNPSSPEEAQPIPDAVAPKVPSDAFPARCLSVEALNTNPVRGAPYTRYLHRAAPSVYDEDASIYTLELGASLMLADRQSGDAGVRGNVYFISTTDYVQHKYEPGHPNANEFMRKVDDVIGRMHATGARIAVTADHGMNEKCGFDGKPRVVYLESLLTEAGLEGRVVLPITDPYLAHHGALGGYATVYCKDKSQLMSAMSLLRSQPGVYTVMGKEDAAKALDLPADRIGDIVVLGDRQTVLGKSPASHDLSALAGARLRSHGGLDEATVPLLVNRALTYELGRKVTMGKARNYDLFDVLLNGIDPASEKIMGF